MLAESMIDTFLMSEIITISVLCQNLRMVVIKFGFSRRACASTVFFSVVRNGEPVAVLYCCFRLTFIATARKETTW